MRYLVLSLAAVAVVVGGIGCGTGGTGNDQVPPSALFKADAGNDRAAGEGDTVTLRATAIRGTAPYFYRWSVERIPDTAETVTLLSPTEAETTTSALATQGRYVFRVVIVDASGTDSYDFVTINVGAPGTGSVTELKVSIEGPETIPPGERGELRAVVEGEGSFTYAWEAVTSTVVNFEAADQDVTGFTVDTEGTVVVRVTVRDEAANAVGAAELSIEVAEAGTLRVTATGPERLEVNQVVELAATVTNSNGALSYAWTVTDGQADLTQADQATVTVRPKAVGRLAVKVQVTDASDGATGNAEYVVTVDAATDPLTLQATGPDILKTGDVGALSVQIEGNESFDEVTYAWNVVSGDATVADSSAAETTVTAGQAETVHVRVTVIAASATETRAAESDVFVVTYAEDRPQVELVITNFGTIVFELRPDVAPKTVANFLRYVDDGFYDGLLVHRVVPDFVIQGGGFRLDDAGQPEAVEVRDPVESEADNGLSNIRGTVAMALRGEDVNSGTSQWFVNLVNNDSTGTTDLDAMNFTVFASVVDGLDVVDAIAAVETTTKGQLQDTPVESVVMESVARRASGSP